MKCPSKSFFSERLIIGTGNLNVAFHDHWQYKIAPIWSWSYQHESTCSAYLLFQTAMEATYELLQSNPQDRKGNSAGKSRNRRYISGLALLAIIICLLYLRHGPPFHQIEIATDDEVVKQCPSNLPPLATPPVPINLWAALSVEDTVEIRRWLEAPERQLNLTPTREAAGSDNSLYNIETYYPAKVDALAYLTNPSSVLAPERFARVTIHHGARFKPIVKDYLVGPLPVSSYTSMKELTEIYHRDIPYNARGGSFTEIGQLLRKIMAPLAEATKVCVPEASIDTL